MEASEHLPTLRQRTLTLANSEPELHADPSTLPLDTLKLEVDSRAALLIAGIADMVLNDQTQDLAVEYVKSGYPVWRRWYSKIDARKRPYIPEALDTHLPQFMVSVFLSQLRQAYADPAGEAAYDDLEYYRDAYYERSPSKLTTEEQYTSIETLVIAGLNTAISHTEIVSQSLKALAVSEAMSPEEMKQLFEKSSHLLSLLGRLSLTDLERYVDLINLHPEVLYGMLDLHHSGDTSGQGDEVRASFRSRVFGVMRELDESDRADNGHRPHLGCPAAVLPPGRGQKSVIHKFWDWHVGILDKAGYWEHGRLKL